MTHTYLLNGTAFLKAFSTSATVALASSATVQRPCAYNVLARAAFRRETLTRSTSSLWTPKLSLVWYWDNSSSMLCQPKRLQNTVTIPEGRAGCLAAQLSMWSSSQSNVLLFGAGFLWVSSCVYTIIVMVYTHNQAKRDLRHISKHICWV